MSKFSFFLIFIFSNLFSAEKSNWTYQYTYKLKKDEIANIVVSTQDTNNSLFFRWTLIVGNRVTLLATYKGYPTQYILYKKRRLNRVKFNLLPDGANRVAEKSYMLLELDKINKKKQEVNFNVFIKDDKKRISIDFQRIAKK